ncbi:MAG TPA: hypothetical protein VJI13_00205 [Candidatus Norongarragalinales archaeon]|nr:hypothetical protein [Candidatus Norongarragalinales archaeon]
MAISKPGIISLLVGLLVLFASWYLGFQASGLAQMLIVTVQGGAILFGLFMMLIGILMLVI